MPSEMLTLLYSCELGVLRIEGQNKFPRWSSVDRSQQLGRNSIRFAGAVSLTVYILPSKTIPWFCLTTMPSIEKYMEPTMKFRRMTMLSKRFDSKVRSPLSRSAMQAQCSALRSATAQIITFCQTILSSCCHLPSLLCRRHGLVPRVHCADAQPRDARECRKKKGRGRVKAPCWTPFIHERNATTSSWSIITIATKQNKQTNKQTKNSEWYFSAAL